MIKKRKIPLRICVGCQQKKPKKELIRVVRTKEASATLDLTGKMPGRGAYVCPLQACLKKAIKGRRFEKTLQISVSDQLETELSNILEKENEVQGS